MRYSYDTNNPNQLMSVSDNTNNPKGFVDGTNTGDDYASYSSRIVTAGGLKRKK